MINNESLKQFLKVVLNKKVELISADDINKIKTVCISTINENQEHTENFNDLLQFNNLEKIIIEKSLITEKEINILIQIGSLLSIEFVRCAFENEILLSKLYNIQSLYLNNSIIRDYSFLNTSYNKLEDFRIFNPYDETELDLTLLKDKVQLKKLYLERCILTNFQNLILPLLEELSLLNTSIDNFEFIKNNPNLSLMFISERYLENSIIKNYQNKIKFKTNLIEYTFEESETEILSISNKK